MLSKQIIHFYQSLIPPVKLPRGTEVLYPQQQSAVINVINTFYKKYYADNNTRTLIFGINPGRFGAGVTGINFTAAKQLTENCRIPHPFKMQSELSAEFIYEAIEKYGGVEKFCNQFFISAVSPLGYIKNGVNLNYYDDKKLQQAVTPFIIDCIEKQLKWRVNKELCICIGGEKNYTFLSGLNEKYKWFGEIVPLPHPRFILQYRRKSKEIYLSQYMAAFCKG